MEFINLKREYETIKDDIDSALKRVINSCKFIMGEEVFKLEEEIAEFLGAKFAVGVSSGTDALLISLMASGVSQDDEVITTPFTFIATAEVISLLKAKPVFVDIEEDTCNIDKTRIEAAITDKTKAIIPIHLYGQCSDMDEIMKIAKSHNIAVIEDAAQAFGSEYKGKKAGTIGDAGALSFFPSKNLGCYGDGGMILTNDEELANKAKMLRVHGSSGKYEHKILGLNARLDSLQAAILRVKLKNFKKNLEARLERANYYNESLKDIVRVPIEREYNLHTYNQYTISTKKRDLLRKHLSDCGIPTAIHYPKPIHLQEAFAFTGYSEGDFPVSEKVSCEVISIPFSPFITRDEQDKVIEEIKSFFT